MTAFRQKANVTTLYSTSWLLGSVLIPEQNVSSLKLSGCVNAPTHFHV